MRRATLAPVACCVALALLFGIMGCSRSGQQPSDVEGQESVFKGSLSESTGDREHYPRMLFAFPFLNDNTVSWTCNVADDDIVGFVGYRVVTPSQEAYGDPPLDEKGEPILTRLTVFCFKGKREGTTSVTFRLSSPWEDNTDDDEVVTYYLSVNEELNVAVLSGDGDERYGLCYAGCGADEWLDVVESMRGEDQDETIDEGQTMSPTQFEEYYTYDEVPTDDYVPQDDNSWENGGGSNTGGDDSGGSTGGGGGGGDDSGGTGGGSDDTGGGSGGTTEPPGDDTGGGGGDTGGTTPPDPGTTDPGTNEPDPGEGSDANTTDTSTTGATYSLQSTEESGAGATTASP